MKPLKTATAITLSLFTMMALANAGTTAAYCMELGDFADRAARMHLYGTIPLDSMLVVAKQFEQQYGGPPGLAQATVVAAYELPPKPTDTSRDTAASIFAGKVDLACLQYD